VDRDGNKRLGAERPVKPLHVSCSVNGTYQCHVDEPVNGDDGCFIQTLTRGQWMPKKYEKMRDKFKKEGLSDKAAKKKAARIYNEQRKPGQKPVTRKKHRKSKRGKK
jgi:hypothetical protein